MTVSTDSPDEQRTGGAPPGEQKRWKFPTAFTVLGIVLLGVWVASFVIPSGAYKIDPETAGPQPGTYQQLPSCDAAPEDESCVDKSLGAQFKTLWTATPNGLYGIQNLLADPGLPFCAYHCAATVGMATRCIGAGSGDARQVRDCVGTLCRCRRMTKEIKL